MKKTRALCLLLISTAIFLSGCQMDYMPELTEEQSSLISEYAAGLLLKYDKNLGKLVDDATIEKADQKEALRQANLEELRKKKEEAKAGEPKGETPIQEETKAPFTGIADFYGIEGFTVEYVGHFVADAYPEENSEDMYFAMDASEGNKLLVLQFMARNDMQQEAELDFFTKSPRFKISVNDGEMRNALSTMLLDDMSIYKDTVPAGESVMLVLVREVTEAEGQELHTISLSLKNDSESVTTLLE